MNNSEVKKTLLIYRPDSADANDPQIAEALAIARRDPELKEWLERQSQFHSTVRARFQEISIPDTLKENILAQSKVIRSQVWWRDPGWLRAVASVLLFIGVCYGVVRFWNKTDSHDNFADYQFRMVRSALREYRMDIESSDPAQVRQWMTQKNAPADFTIPTGLSKLHLTGGGVLSWRSNPVSMMCFDRGDKQMLFLFVMDRAAVKDPPLGKPSPTQISKLQTISWSEGGKTYLLAGPTGEDFEKYF